MRAASRKIYIIPVVLFVLAICMHYYAGYMLKRYRWVPVTIPINLTVGITKLPEFQVDLSTKYVIELVSDRNLPMQELNCLLGTPFGKSEECKDKTSPVDISWKLTSEGAFIASGSSREKNGASLGVKISRFIGEFNGTPGTSYNLEIQSLKDASILASTNPKIQVAVNSMEFKGHVVNSQLLNLCAVLLAVIGAARLVANSVSYYRLRRSNET